MKIIAVERKGLLSDFTDWGVTDQYADLFISKCDDNGQVIALKPFMYNDTIQFDDPRQWLSACAAYWCRAYREAETNIEQVEALSSIRALFYASGTMRIPAVVAQINKWWTNSYELHNLPAPNRSMVIAQRNGFRSSILNSSFLSKH